jgi:NAD-dependent deacetylase
VFAKHGKPSGELRGGLRNPKIENMKKIVVLTGSGISAESGLKTFRDSGGLWENHRVEDVASPDGWRKDPAMVLEFYNQRRKQALMAQPNAAHIALAKLEERFKVQIITQNVDDLHERGGSSNVLHLHGELFKVRSSLDESLVFDIKDVAANGWELKVGDTCPKGSQLRPHIVWFGEAVPDMHLAKQFAKQADFFVVVGTSMVVYPAASLIEYVPDQTRKCIVDPFIPELRSSVRNLFSIQETATVGVPRLVKQLLA